MTTLFITGSNGMVGRYITAHNTYKDYDVFCLNRPEFDLRSPEKIANMILDKKPAIFLHLAAETDVDLCQSDHDHAFSCNQIATEIIASACATSSTKLVFTSTAYVFGAIAQDSYGVQDQTGALNIYGTSKELAERYIIAHNPNHIIIRPSWMVGGGPDKDQKFVGKIMQMLGNGRKEFSAVDDQFGSLSYGKSVADDIFRLIKDDFRGIYHSSSHGIISRLDMMRFMVQNLGLNDIEITPISAAEFPRTTPLAQSYALHSQYDQCNQNLWQKDLGEYLKEFQD